MLKNEKPRKKIGKYIICPKCKTKIFIDSEEEQENIIRLGNLKVYECFCGEEIILDN